MVNIYAISPSTISYCWWLIESHATVHTYRTGQSNRSVIGSLDSVGKKPVPAIFKDYMRLMNVHIRYLDSKSYTVRWICALLRQNI